MKRLVPAILVTAVLPALSGCLLISGLLGGMGLITTGPLQYAGTAYTVAEYSYEYAVNDKTPDEVLVAKMDFLFEEEDAPARPAPLLTADSEPAPRKALPVETTPPPPEPNVILAEAATPTAVSGKSKEQQIVKAQTAMKMKPAAKAKPARSAARRAQPKRLPSAARPQPHFTYVEHNPDPLRIRLDRMEQGLAQAERIAMASPEAGVRCGVEQGDAGRTGTAISGSWSIRHKVNWTFPARADGTNAHLIGSLQLVSPG